MSAGAPLRAAALGWLAMGLFLFGILWLTLLPSLVAALLVYVLVNQLTPLLSNRLLRGEGPRLLAVSIIAAIVIALIVAAGTAVAALLRESRETLPALIASMAEIIEHSRQRLPLWLVDYLPADPEELRQLTVRWLREHAQLFQGAGTGLGVGLLHVLIGMIIGGLLSLETAAAVRAGRPLAAAIALRGLRLSAAFRQVVFAQIWISAINTVCTGVFLVLILPRFGIQLPFAKTLIVLTFVIGLIPIAGNVISNTAIFIVSLSHSFTVALWVLGFLVAIHKLEYFLNARIVGAHIQAKAWELLVAMLLMESAFGIPGLVAAPIYYAYLKSELREQGLV